MKCICTITLFLCFSAVSFAQDVVKLTGKAELLASPCLTDPCLPKSAWGINVDTATFILTKHNQLIGDENENLLIYGSGYSEGDDLVLFGEVSENKDLSGVVFYECEILDKEHKDTTIYNGEALNLYFDFPNHECGINVLNHPLHYSSSTLAYNGSFDTATYSYSPSEDFTGADTVAFLTGCGYLSDDNYAKVVEYVINVSDENANKTTYIYDTIYSGVTEYIDTPYSEGLSVLSESNHKGDARTVWLELMFPTFLYKSAAGYIGNDTIKVLNASYGLGPDTLVYILYCRPFEFPDETVTVKYVTENCNHDGHETKIEAHYQTDSVLIKGTVTANCCAHKRVLATYQNNAINISYDLTSGGCACNCDYDYEVLLPLEGNETHVKLGSQLIVLGTGSEYYDNQVSVFPNPAKTSFSIATNAIYTHIKILSLDGKLLKQQLQSDAYSVDSFATGSYLVCLFDGNKLILTETLHVVQ